MKEKTDLEIRKNIFSLLKKNPGLNLTTIAELTHISIPLAVYHLRYLERREILISSKESGFKRYYLKDQIGVHSKKILSVLRQDIPLRIVLIILQYPCIPHKELMKHFNLSASTLSYHLKKLVVVGVVAEQRDGEKNGYVIVNEKEIVTLLLQYKPSKILKRFTDAWTDFSVQ